MATHLHNYINIAPQNQDSRIILDPQSEGGLRTEGPRKTGLGLILQDKRTPEQTQSNKDIANDFIRVLTKEYGHEIASIFQENYLQDHVNKGSPLTGYRITAVLDKANQLRDSMMSENEAILNRCLPELTRTALDNIGHTDALPLEEAQAIVHQAILESPAFSLMAVMDKDLHVLNSLDLSGIADDGEGRRRVDEKFTREFIGVAESALLETLEERRNNLPD